MKSIKAFIPIIVILGFSTIISCNSKPLVIASIGDSITSGAKHKKQSETAYPKVLGNILGKDYHVINCGRSGTTALKKSNAPYWNSNQFSNVFALHPDIITIKLGTNDTKPNHWNPKDYQKSYQSLIDTLLTIQPQPKIYICLPVPVFPHNKFKIRGEILNHKVIPIVKKLAEDNHLALIDLHEPLLNKGELFPDGVHPEEEGAALIAKLIAQEIKEHH